MKILYKCQCMAQEAEVEVPERLPIEDVVKWVEGTLAVEVSLDHSRRSPHCMSRIMEYVKIPYDENGKGVGFE